MVELNGSSLAHPGEMWAKVRDLNTWQSIRDYTSENMIVRSLFESLESKSAGDLDPAKVIWLFPKTDLRRDPWEWKIHAQWVVELRRGGETRSFRGSATVPVPLRPKASVESAVRMYEYVMETPTPMTLEEVHLWYVPGHYELMEMARELAEKALSGNDGLAKYVALGLRETREYQMRMAVFGNMTWWYDVVSSNLTRKKEVEVKKLDNETYRANARAIIRYTEWIRLVGNVTPVNVLQIGCADADAFFLPSKDGSFARAHEIYLTDGKPQVLRLRWVKVSVEKSVGATAEAPTEDEAVEEAMKLLDKRIARAESSIRRIVENRDKLREVEPLLFRTFLIPEDFEFRCEGS